MIIGDQTETVGQWLPGKGSEWCMHAHSIRKCAQSQKEMGEKRDPPLTCLCADGWLCLLSISHIKDYQPFERLIRIHYWFLASKSLICSSRQWTSNSPGQQKTSQDNSYGDGHAAGIELQSDTSLSTENKPARMTRAMCNQQSSLLIQRQKREESQGNG